MSVLDDCFAFPQRRMLHSEALALLRNLARALEGTEEIDIREATGRISAEAVYAPRAIPAHTNAAVDGYAFSFEDYTAKQGALFTIGGRAAAGDPLQNVAPAHSAIRIFTGAIVPEGCDTVAMQEDCRLEKDTAVFIPAGLRRGANRRLAGEDTAEGTAVIHRGQRLRPQDVAAIASTGLAKIACFKKPRICFFSTGNEILSPGAPFSPGKVYDSNGPMLFGLFAPLGLTLVHGGILPDSREAVHDALHSAARNYDLIVTTGGASLGEEDHVVAALRAAESLSLWQLAIKPGRPMGLGKIGSCLCFALPGNPVAVLVCALLYVWPVIRCLAGEAWIEPRRLPFRAGFEIKSRRPGRREFFRGWLESDADQFIVRKYERDGSGLISSLRSAGGLIEISEGIEKVEEGDTVSFIPFSAFGIF